jgi:hypothetical protein
MVPKDIWFPSTFELLLARSEKAVEFIILTPRVPTVGAKTYIYTLATSFDDGILSNWLTSCKGYKRSELYRSLKHSLLSKHDQEHICLI